MSHVITVDLVIKDLDALERACKRLGWEFHRNKKTYTYVGIWVDDSPVPRDLFTKDEAGDQEHARVVAMSYHERKAYMEAMLGKCEHCIRLPGHECEVGLVNVGGGLVITYDWASTLYDVFGRPGTAEYNFPLKQAYAWAACTLQAERMGYAWSEVTDEKGNLEVTINGGGY